MRTAFLLIVAAAVVACDSSTEPDPTVYAWQAALAGQDEFADVTGSVSVTAGQNFTAEVQITGAAADAEYSWHVASGTCADPGTMLGNGASYSKIETDEEGAGEAKSTVSATLDPEGEYLAEVYFVEEGEGEEEDVIVVIACGDVELEED